MYSESFQLFMHLLTTRSADSIFHATIYIYLRLVSLILEEKCVFLTIKSELYILQCFIVVLLLSQACFLAALHKDAH